MYKASQKIIITIAENIPKSLVLLHSLGKFSNSQRFDQNSIPSKFFFELSNNLGDQTFPCQVSGSEYQLV